jgi:hypothetical protein
MVRFDRLLIGPTEEELERALAEAAAGANRGKRGNLLKWPPANLHNRLAGVADQREGYRQWVAGRKAASDWQPGRVERSAVALAWWTDHLGRKHLRVVGARGMFRGDQQQAVLSPGEPVPPRALIYPGRLLQREKPAQSAVWALCECGASGPLNELGWMGPCCGPCHDRRESGDAPLVGPRAALCVPEVDVFDLAWWGADGQALVCRAAPPKDARVWRPPTGEVEQLPFLAPVNRLASAPSAGLVAFGAGPRVHVLGRDGLRKELAAPGDGEASTVALSADGSLLAVGGDGLIVWRLVDGWFLLKSGAPAAVLGFGPEARTLVTLESSQPFLRDLKTGEADTLLEASEARSLNDVALSPDGRWLAVGGLGGKVFLHRLDATLAPRQELSSKKVGGVMTFSPDGSVLAYAAEEGRVVFWSVAGPCELGTLRLLGRRPSALAFSPGGHYLAVGMVGNLLLWPWRELLGLAP